MHSTPYDQFLSLPDIPIQYDTDNTVAASILSNHKVPRPARLVRWGLELQTYLPWLRIAYRLGKDNFVADHLCRNPYDEHYVVLPKDTIEVPDDLYEHLASFRLGSRQFKLFESKVQNTISEIWSAYTELSEQQADDLKEKLTYGGISGLVQLALAGTFKLVSLATRRRNGVVALRPRAPPRRGGGVVV